MAIVPVPSTSSSIISLKIVNESASSVLSTLAEVSSVVASVSSEVISSDVLFSEVISSEVTSSSEVVSSEVTSIIESSISNSSFISAIVATEL